MAVTWQIGDRIQNRWEIHNVLRGGMGIVYVVYDHESREALAAKTFHDGAFARDSRNAERFAREALAWVNLDLHENVTQARFVERIDGKPFLFLEYVGGGDLSRWIRTLRLTEDLPLVLRFAIQFCDGMRHAISKGIKAHRDIKPQNCLVGWDNTLKITDFGLAKVFDGTAISDWDKGESDDNNRSEGLNIGITRTGCCAGTPPYMAPEQFDDVKHVDVRADIYSFGVMLFEMITGHLPFLGKTWGEFERLHKSQPPPKFETHYLGIETLIKSCLAKDPSSRPEDFGAVRELLAGLYATVAGAPPPQPAAGADLDAVRLGNKGHSLHTLGKLDEALVCFDRALSALPRVAAAWSNKGAILGEMGRLEEAHACLDRAIELNPSSDLAWSLKGESFRRHGHRTQALNCHDRALALNPRNAIGWFNKGVTLAELGNHVDALVCYEHALSIDPRHVDTLCNKATSLATLGRNKEMLSCLDRALEINPRSEYLWYNLGLGSERSENYDLAVECYDRAIELNPQFGLPWNNKAAVFVRLGQNEKAMPYLDRALELNPRHIDAWLNKAAALVALGRNEEALTCSDHALTLDRNDADVWLNKSAALYGLRRVQEAIYCLDRAISIRPRDARAWFNKAMVLKECERYGDALACLEKAKLFCLQQADQFIVPLRQVLNKGV